MIKDEQIRFRVTPEEKQLIASSAKKQGMTTTKYLFSLVLKDTSPLTHEQRIENSISERQIINNLLTNPEIPDYVKKQIGKELREYVGYTN